MKLRRFLIDKFSGRCRAFVDKPYEPDEVVETLVGLIDKNKTVASEVLSR
jgi:hypothetical protein